MDFRHRLSRRALYSLAALAGLGLAVPPPKAKLEPLPAAVLTIPPTTKADAALPAAKVPVQATPAPVIVRPMPMLSAPYAAPVIVAKGGLIPVDPGALVATFRRFVGIKEEPPGSNQGRMVDRFNASAGLDRSERAPWCASVTHYGYAEIGAPDRPGAYSPSWYQKTRVIPPELVQPGDVGLIYFPSKGRYAHTIAAIESVQKSGRVVTAYVTLEGNTNAQGSREGDQFARRIRPVATVTVVRWIR